MTGGGALEGGGGVGGGKDGKIHKDSLLRLYQNPFVLTGIVIINSLLFQFLFFYLNILILISHQ